MPFTIKQIVEGEMANILTLSIIKRSESPFNSLIIVVQKLDASHRLCVDFRKLNEVLVDDAEPIPLSDELLASVGTKFFSELDFAKGYCSRPTRGTTIFYMCILVSIHTGHVH